MKRKPKVGDVYKIQYKDHTGQTKKGFEDWYFVFVITKIDNDNSVVKTKNLGLLIGNSLFFKNHILFNRTLGACQIESTLNAHGILQKHDFIYFARLAPRYYRIFGIYFVKDSND